ncbi:uncharacterized protein LOC128883688 [Hylaeus volcanicus]|uniref:uncharacterized protein LOC128883688 n=1 Tax=Hylaeus volcanicus TaxID=313075 RepID=UPI0023B7F2EE|nr:uncharacterized protein LOC128883688 [Hylaeus volcanicus]
MPPHYSSTEIHSKQNFAKESKYNHKCIDIMSPCRSPSTSSTKSSCHSPSEKTTPEVVATNPFFSNEVLISFFQLSCQVFTRGYSLSNIVARTDEQYNLLTFLHQIMTTPVFEALPFLYIYGPPGTGKTTTVMHTLSLLKESSDVSEFLDEKWMASSCYINAAMLGSYEEFLVAFSKIVSPTITKETVYKLAKETVLLDVEQTLLSIIQLGQPRVTRSSKKSPFKKTIIVLDEFDQLTALLNKKSQSGKVKTNSNVMMVFKKICHLLLRSEINQRIVIIGVSNAHAYASLSTLLTDKTSSPLQLHTIVFKPYTVENMRDIILHRLETAKTHMQTQLESNDPITMKLLRKDFQEHSPLTGSEISFITQKLAAQSGDCRKLLDVCRALVTKKLHLLEEQVFKVKSGSADEESTLECLKSPEKKIRSVGYESTSICNSSSYHLNELTDKIQHFNFKDDIGLNSCEKSERNCLNIISCIPLHQQILVCAICYTFRQKTTKQPHETSNSDVELTLKDVQMFYKQLCVTHELPIVFKDVRQLYNDGMSVLQDRGLILFSRQSADAKRNTNKANSSTMRSKLSVNTTNVPSQSMGLWTLQLCFSESILSSSLSAHNEIFKNLIQNPAPILCSN